MKTKYLALLAGILLTGCASEIKHDVTVTVNPEKIEDVIPIEEYVDSTYYDLIPLEKTQLPIGEITKMQVDDDKIFIMDKTTHSINVFDQTGKNLLTLQKLGKAQNEYLQITDFYYSEGVIYIADILRRAVIEYDLKGQFIKAIDFSKYWANRIFVLNKIIYLVNEYSETETGNNLIFKLDPKGNLIDTYLPFENQYMQSSDFSCEKDNDKMIYGQKPDNTFYQISNEGCKELFHLSFGKYDMPEDVKVMNDREIMQSDLNNNYAHGIEQFHVTDKNIFILAEDMNWDKFYIIYNRETGHVDHVCKGFNIDNFKLKSFITIPIVSDGYIYSPVSFEAFGQLSTYLNKFESENVNPKYLSDVTNVNSTLEIDSNPVIIKYRLK